MRRHTAVLVTVGVALAAAAPAEAAKAPSKSQRAQIAQAAGVPASCLTIRVSTINRAYSSYTFNVARASSKTCREHGSNGITVLRLKSGVWRQAWAGSDCTSPGELGAPKNVWRELTRSFCGR